MFYRTIFVCLVGFVLVKLEKMDLEITFKVNTVMTPSRINSITCDHNNEEKLKNIYTAYEGEYLNLTTKYKSLINHFICRDFTNENVNFNYKKTSFKNETDFKVEKRMGTLWNCTILTNQNNGAFTPTVKYSEIPYAAAYCFMKIHVRRKEPPQTILVNNMVLPAVRTNLSEKLVDFIAEYQYADGDIVAVTCANFGNEEPNLTMEYVMAGTKSDNSIMKNISSIKAIGFVTKMHSGHTNSYMICTYKGPTDYTKVMVRFVMRTQFQMVSIKINGMHLRPNHHNLLNNAYRIEYKYRRHLQPINLTCEVMRTDVKLKVLDSSFAKVTTSYKKTELIPNKKTAISFRLPTTTAHKHLACSADYPNGTSAEQVTINYTEGNFPVELYPLHVEFLSNGTVMELYSDNQIKFIFYEFEDGETLNLKCGPLLQLLPPGPILYLELKYSKENISEKCKTKDCMVSKIMLLSDSDENNTIVCYLKEELYTSSLNKADTEQNKIIIILHKRVLTTTTTTTTTTTSTAPLPIVNRISSTTISTTTVASEKGPAEEPSWMVPVVIGCSIACIVIFCVSIAIIKLRKRNHSQGGPHNRNYENLGEPSEASIPAHPPQWENNYAVPVDRRTDDTTYSVPCQPAELYATPTPKNLRNKKQKVVDPTYAILAVPKGRGRKNTFKETEDPNYSEVYANRKEECYAKVLPKSVRNKMEQDNPYSYVTNEPPYVNNVDPEPMYCEPAKALGGQYANLNSSHYANTNAPEYVEPSYCEPQKRMK